MAKEVVKNDSVKQDSTEIAKHVAYLSSENEMLKNRLKQASDQIQMYQRSEFFTRLEWLWRVITWERSEEVFSKDFVADKAEEFKSLMTVPAQQEEE